MANGFRKKDSARIVWDTKPKRAPNPKDIEFQTAEVVIPNPEKAVQLPISFPASAHAAAGRRDNLFAPEEIDKTKMNRLIWGDNLLAMQALLAQGYEGKINLIYIDPPFDSKKGTRFSETLDVESRGVQMSDVWEISQITAPFSEYTGYNTQKPEELIERIFNSSTQEGDVVADFFVGSGTTLAVAEKLNRRWIGCELGKVGIQVTRGRLVEQEANPFIIENIGNYQREMIYLSGGRIYEMQKIILKLYGATPLTNRNDLGVRKDGNTLELVYCGYPDRAVTARKAEELAAEAREHLLKMVKDNFVVRIDYWAVGWHYDGFTFKSQWQDLRGSGRKTKVVNTKTMRAYEKPGTYTSAVRVVDIFGNDAIGTLEVKI